MKSKLAICLLALAVAASAQTANSDPGPATKAPAAPALPTLLSGLEQASQAAAARLMELRIDKWKGPGDAKDRYQQNSAALQRNMVYALPEIIAEVRQSPESLASNFKLYRNVDALHDVLANLTAAAAEVGRGDDYRDLAEHSAALDGLRRGLAERFEMLAEAKDRALGGGTKASKSTTTTNKSGVKRIIVDDEMPPKKRK